MEKTRHTDEEREVLLGCAIKLGLLAEDAPAPTFEELEAIGERMLGCLELILNMDGEQSPTTVGNALAVMARETKKLGGKDAYDLSKQVRALSERVKELAA